MEACASPKVKQDKTDIRCLLFPFPFSPLFFLGKCFNPRRDNVAVVGREGVTMFLSKMCFVVTVLPLISPRVREIL